MTTSQKAWTYALIGVGIYVALVVVTAMVLNNADVSRPILRAMFWPISLTRYLLGGF